MRFVRLFSALLALSLVTSLIASSGTLARAQSTDEAEEAVEEAEERADQASGLVDEAVENREDIERQLAESIARLNELTAELSEVGADIDRIASQVGYADVELAGIEADIETQAVDAYMTVVASPSVNVMNSGTVEKALVASSVVEDVVAAGRLTVSDLFAQRKGLMDLQQSFLADQEEYADLQEEVDAEVERYTELYERADASVAEAIREAQAADRAYREALTAVEVARAKEDEQRRQDNRSARDDTTTTSPPTTAPPSSGTSPTTTAPETTTSTPGGGGGSWNHPPAVEQWRSLVQQFFPSNRVEEALVIINCESNGDPDAVNPYSGAAGLFQFLPSTWASTAPQAGYPNASPYEPEANTASAAWLANRYQELGLYYWQAWNCKRMLS